MVGKIDFRKFFLSTCIGIILRLTILMCVVFNDIVCGLLSFVRLVSYACGEVGVDCAVRCEGGTLVWCV